MTFSAEALYRSEHDEDPVVLATDADVDALIDALLAEEWTHNLANIYIRQRPLNAAGVPDHELCVGVDAERAVGGLRWYAGDEGSWYSLGAPSEFDEVIYYYMGSDTQFPTDSDISLDVARRAVKEFLASGGRRPTCVPWQPDPFAVGS